jgi:hypothetical protein
MVKTLSKIERKIIGIPQAERAKLPICGTCGAKLKATKDFGLCSGLPEKYHREKQVLDDGAKHYTAICDHQPREHIFFPNGDHYAYKFQGWRLT